MRGFTLLEATLALMLISMSLILFLQQEYRARWQLEALFHKTSALYQVLALKERLLSNEDGAFQKRELAIWKSELAESLPNGAGELHATANLYDILVTWKDRKLNQLRLRIPK